MSKFITGFDLNQAVFNIIKEAKSNLMIVSPYIKLDDTFKRLFDFHLDNYNLRITLVFGKNEGHVNKSFNSSDLEYFKKFPDISIIYAPKLHAKYYANETIGVVTSINLYDFSFKNNIEFGVLFENNIFSRLSKNTDDQVWDACQKIAEENEVIFIKRPIIKSNTFSQDEYIDSKILCDRSTELYSSKIIELGNKKLADFKEEIDFKEEKTKKEWRQDEKLQQNINLKHVDEKKSFNENLTTIGYCIRTGEKIPFNPDRPLSDKAFQSWSKFKNRDYPENFCHYSGEPSNGGSSVAKPILHKYWKKAQQLDIS